MASDHIEIRGARQHNLKGIDVDIPLHQLTVVTGVSGSGKSTLAFDILYAEGQRRYVESFSTYTRQFLERMEKPDVDHIGGIPPAVAIDQRRPVTTSRSTVGTVTELHDHLKLLFAKLGVLAVPRAAAVASSAPPRRHRRRFCSRSSAGDGGACSASPSRCPTCRGRRSPPALAREGFTRAWLDGAVQRARRAWPRRPRVRSTSSSTVSPSSARPAAAPGRRRSSRRSPTAKVGSGSSRVDGGERRELQRRPRLHRVRHHLPRPDAEPLLVQQPARRLRDCRGFGRIIDLDLDLVDPRHRRARSQGGAIKPWTTPSTTEERRELLAFCRRRKIPIDVPVGAPRAPSSAGSVEDGDDRFFGIRGWFRWLERKTYKMHVRVLLSRYRSYRTCPACDGQPRQARRARLPHRRPLDRRREPHERRRRARVLRQPRGRRRARSGARRSCSARSARASRTCVEVGLGYLTLDRQSRTLSGGELERVDLTTAVGSSLVNTLYVLDEPSIGLHPRDSARLVGIMRNLCARRNTVVVVEHDPEIIAAADHVIDMGPGAGAAGGDGRRGRARSRTSSPTRDSLTGRYLSGSAPHPDRRNGGAPRAAQLALTIRNARANNLRGIDVTIPLARMVCITGVSGSGKSTLVEEVLYRGLLRRRGPLDRAARRLRRHRRRREDRRGDLRRPGADRLDPARQRRDLHQDVRRRAPALRGDRARALARLLGRDVLLQRRGRPLRDLSRRRLRAGRDAVPLRRAARSARRCNGRRYGPEVLEVRYRDRSDRRRPRRSRFARRSPSSPTRPDIAQALQPLVDVGLEYLRLGQPLSTLSAGESQRIKLAAHLGRDAKAHTLFIFDEPTTGLHFADIERLLGAFAKLVGARPLAAGRRAQRRGHQVRRSRDRPRTGGRRRRRRGRRRRHARGDRRLSASHTGRFLRPRSAAGPRVAPRGRRRRRRAGGRRRPRHDPHRRRARAQPPQSRPRAAARPHDRRHRALGLREVDPRLRRRVRRRAAPLPREPLDLRAAVHASAAASRRRPRLGHSADHRDRAALEPRRAEVDRRDRDRGRALSAAALRQGRRAALRSLRSSRSSRSRAARSRAGSPSASATATSRCSRRSSAAGRVSIATCCAPRAACEYTAGARRRAAAPARAAARARPLPRARRRRRGRAPRRRLAARSGSRKPVARCAPARRPASSWRSPAARSTCSASGSSARPAGSATTSSIPRLFSFNSRQGACPACQGLGISDRARCRARGRRSDALAARRRDRGPRRARSRRARSGSCCAPSRRRESPSIGRSSG